LWSKHSFIRDLIDINGKLFSLQQVKPVTESVKQQRKNWDVKEFLQEHKKQAEDTVKTINAIIK
jgi:hypothetical protein